MKGKEAGAKASASKPVAADDVFAVRMLVGPRAGQVVRVSRARAVELCDGWTPQAELVAARPAARETR